jgi:hypothetical protein
LGVVVEVGGTHYDHVSADGHGKSEAVASNAVGGRQLGDLSHDSRIVLVYEGALDGTVGFSDNNGIAVDGDAIAELVVGCAVGRGQFCDLIEGDWRLPTCEGAEGKYDAGKY